MKKFGIRLALAAATLVASIGAQAGVLRTTVTFDPVDTSELILGDVGVLVNGDAFTQAGLAGRTMFFNTFSNSPAAQPLDLVGALLNGACADLLCPSNNSTNYLAMLDDGAVAFGSTDGFRFSVKSFNASFIGNGDPFSTSLPGFVALQGVRDNVATTAYFALTGLDAGGKLNFGNINTGAFGNTEFDFVFAFGYTCTAFSGANCIAFSSNQAQFALDDITIEHVPEPASLALLAIAGIAAGSVKRRRAA